MAIAVRAGRRFMGRLAKDGDLLTQLTAICREQGVTLGSVRAIGALSRARVGYYDQEARVYQYLDFPQDLEILALVGNVSLKEGQPMVHAHLTLGDAQGRALGGHLAEGCQVFACEYELTEYLAEGPLERGFDQPTGLMLWTRS